VDRGPYGEQVPGRLSSPTRPRAARSGSTRPETCGREGCVPAVEVATVRLEPVRLPDGGETTPACPNTTDDDRQGSRRVVITVGRDGG
jgi:hypothetical protein